MVVTLRRETSKTVQEPFFADCRGRTNGLGRAAHIGDCLDDWVDDATEIGFDTFLEFSEGVDQEKEHAGFALGIVVVFERKIGGEEDVMVQVPDHLRRGRFPMTCRSHGSWEGWKGRR